MIGRKLFYLVGAVLVVVGAIWIGQASGVFPYPASSFMINDPKWEVYGGAAVVAGIILIAFGYRGRKR